MIEASIAGHRDASKERKKAIREIEMKAETLTEVEALVKDSADELLEAALDFRE